MVKAPPIPPSLKSQLQRLKLSFHRASMDVAEPICPLQRQPLLPRSSAISKAAACFLLCLHHVILLHLCTFMVPCTFARGSAMLEKHDSKWEIS